MDTVLKTAFSVCTLKTLPVTYMKLVRFLVTFQVSLPAGFERLKLDLDSVKIDGSTALKSIKWWNSGAIALGGLISENPNNRRLRSIFYLIFKGRKIQNFLWSELFVTCSNLAELIEIYTSERLKSGK